MNPPFMPLVSTLLMVATVLVPPVIPPGWAGIEPITWHPPTWDDVGGSSVTAAELPNADVAALPGFSAERLLNTEVGIEARFLLTTHDSEFNERVIDTVTDAITTQENARDVAYAPQVHDEAAGLAQRGCEADATDGDTGDVITAVKWSDAETAASVVGCQVTAASGTVLAQRIRTVTQNNAGEHSDETMTLIFHSADDSVLTGKELWNTDEHEALWDALVPGIRHMFDGVSQYGAHEMLDPEAFSTVLDDTVVDDEGNLYLTFPAGFHAQELSDLGVEELATPLTLRLPADDAAPMLSSAGEAIVGELAASSEYEPGAVTPVGERAGHCDLFPCAALTYDDGPSEYTAAMLDSFNAVDVSVSFFMVGSNVGHYAEVARRVVDEGHLALNHSWNHPDLTTLKVREAKSELNRTNTAIYEATGTVPNAFRPPYGEFNDNILDAVNMPAILWDVDTEDWQGISDEELVRRVVSETEPGSIVLQHDIQANTAATVDDVLTGLRNRGFSLVNLEQLFGQMPAEGAWRSGR